MDLDQQKALGTRGPDGQFWPNEYMNDPGHMKNSGYIWAILAMEVVMKAFLEILESLGNTDHRSSFWAILAMEVK